MSVGASATRWQEQAWRYYADLGEVRYAAGFIGHSLGRCRFFVGTIERPGDPPTPIDQDSDTVDQGIAQILDRLKGRDGTLAGLIRVYGKQQFVAGESYLIGSEGLDGETWEMLSPSELRKAAKSVGYERLPDGTNVQLLNADSIVLRLWQRHPQFAMLADSPMRGVLDICESLRVAQAMQNVIDKSRLATAGVLLVPAEADLPTIPADPGDQRGPRLRLADQILEAMEEAITDPTSASALVPIIVQVRGDTIDQFQRIGFERSQDETIADRIDHLIRRLAQGIDLPPERLLGMGDTNHWSVWGISEDTVRTHIAPVAESFCEDITHGFLHPSILAAYPGVDLSRYVVWFDTSQLVLNLNRGKDAVLAFDRYGLSWAALRRELAFSEEDAPDDDEIQRRAKLATSKAPAAGASGPEDVQKGPPPTSETPAPEAPPGEESAARLVGYAVGASDAAIERAMERVGSKIRSKAAGRPSLAGALDGHRSSLVAAMVGPAQVEALGLSSDVLLDGAFDGLCDRLTSVGMPREASQQIVLGVGEVARQRMFDPSVNVLAAVERICALALG